ncbi:CIC11C00000004830 [Sungouiella intermedia]|uniref:CIC11C00000004830 n=1 Tax=Sungouiella intermedia TaxID=45354 RepID=A0A1L0BAD4_9ASCO|nr:CIC11C00000004830 [[Candida] intermedia]
MTRGDIQTIDLDITCAASSDHYSSGFSWKQNVCLVFLDTEEFSYGRVLMHGPFGHSRRVKLLEISDGEYEMA